MGNSGARAAEDSPDAVEALLVECLDRAGTQGPDAIEQFLRDHPGHAPALRRHLEDLGALGFLDEAAAPPPEELPTRLGEYRLIRKLGAGGMGVVFLAEHEPLRRLVALKLLTDRAAASSAGAERFRREARAVARLRHPNLVTVHDAGEAAGTLYLAMELVPGRGLDEVLREAAGRGARVLLEDVLRWGGELASALECAHLAGVVHRDVKPSNVRITPDGRALLLDFGLARSVEEGSLTRTGAFQGSPHYASPEQVEAGPVPAGPRSDVYSLGVTLYECVSGRVPFEGDTTEQVFHGILLREPLPPRRLNRSVPRDVETVILHAMRKEPDGRYASARELGEDLERIRHREPIRARPAGPLLRLGLWSRRNPLLAGSLAALFLVLASGLATSLKLLGQAHRERDAKDLEQKRAEANFDKAFAAVNRMMLTVTDSKLISSPQLDKERKSLMEVAIGLYSELFAQKPEDRVVRYRLAKAHGHLGSALAYRDSHGDAEVHYRRALELLEPLRDAARGDPVFVSALAGFSRKLGVTLVSLARPAEALEVYRQTLTLLEGVPPADDLLALRTAVEMNLGFVLETLGRHREYVEALKRSIARLEKLLESRPDFPNGTYTLGDACYRLATALSRSGIAGQAESQCRRSISLFRELAERDPGTGVGMLARSLTLLGSCLQESAPQEGLKPAREAVQLLEQQTIVFPESASCRAQLVSARVSLAGTLEILHEYDEAERLLGVSVDQAEELARDEREHWGELASALHQQARVHNVLRRLPEALALTGRAIDLQQRILLLRPRDPRPLRSLKANYHLLAFVLSQLGDREGAARSAEDSVRMGPPHAGITLDAARVLVGCLRSVKADEAGSADQRREAVESYATRSIELVCLAVSQGYRDLDHLQSSPDFDPIRRRTGFQQVLRELKRKIAAAAR